MTVPPVVYAGPSISRARVRALLPRAVIKPPIARGDLYRDRMLFHSLFVVIDGVFLHGYAVSPRECVEVCRDGATILGASSMGALRAAECWPAGMIGIGAIFRLFRAGRLLSDDEVAVTFDPDHPERSLSVPLINVRYVASRALRDGVLDRDAAARVVSTAAALYYPERRWPAILSAAGLSSRRSEIEAYARRHDLKRSDAERAVRRAAHLLSTNPALARTGHRLEMPFRLTESTRESDAASLDEAVLERERAQILRWAIGTGECRAFLLERGVGISEPVPENLLLDPDGELASECWRWLMKSDRTLYRWRAHRLGLARSRERRLTPSAEDVSAAETRLAAAHGFATWTELGHRCRHAPEVRAALIAFALEVASVRALQRFEAFSPSDVSRGEPLEGLTAHAFP